MNTPVRRPNAAARAGSKRKPRTGAGPERRAGRRAAVLEVLRGSTSPLGIAEIAARLQVHPNTVRFHLDALTGTGQVERVALPPAGPGRPPAVFRARRRMDPTGPRDYRLLAGILASSLATDPDPAARAIEAGRAWGTRLVDPAEGAEAPSPVRPGKLSGERSGGTRITGDRAVDRLVGLLDGLGFAPERRPAGAGQRIGLRHCPFLELARTEPGVVCPLHLGLMRGALDALGAPVTVERLDPFVEPDLCVAELSATR